ncbi:MAG: PAS domain S-box protein, partial [Prolixibacteraceae bacterium]|nr:PAS domain S-box protein [Prolixibacteraceae bacterium]
MSLHSKLEAVSDLKRNEISKWYLNELADAQTISQNTFFLDFLEKWENRKDLNSTRDLGQFLHIIQNEHDYASLHLLSDQQELIVSTAHRFMQELPEIQEAIAQCLMKKEAVPTGFYHVDKGHAVLLSFVAPLFKHEGEFMGILIMDINPDDYLNPLANHWMVPWQTAESMLLHDEGDSLLVLNDLRLRSQSAMHLRIPRSLNSAMADPLTTGGFVQGVDYRGVATIFHPVSIPGTPWYLVLKIDRDEFYQALRSNLTMSILIISLSIIFTILLIAFVYSYIQKNLYKSLWISKTEHHTTLQSIAEAVITTDNAGFILSMNPMAEKLTGWQESSMKGKGVDQLIHLLKANSGMAVENPVLTVIQELETVNSGEANVLVSRDGRHIPVTYSCSPILNEVSLVQGVVLVLRDQTREREQLQIIEDQKRNLFTLMSNLPGMAFRCLNDARSTMLFVSKGCMELTGYREEEIINNKLIAYNDLIHPEDLDQVISKVEEAIDGKTAYEMEYRIITRQNETCWVWEKGQGIYDDKGKVVAIEGFISNIDHRKQFEAALNSSEHLFHTLSDNASVGIFKTNADGFTTYVNPKWCEISGMPAFEALGDGWMMNVHPDDVEAIKGKWRNSISNSETSVDEYRFVHANGDVVHVKGHATPEFDNGTFMGYVGTITDITDIKIYEEKLKSSNLLLTTLIEKLPDSIYIKDLEGRKILANHANLENIGVQSLDEVIGKTDFDLFPPEIAQKFWEIDRRVMENGEHIIAHEESLVDKQNNIKWLSTSKIPYRNSEGRIIGLIGIGHDITRRKQNEEERLKLLTAITQSPVSISITDVEGNIEFVNPKFCEVSGYSYDEVIGKNHRILKSGTHPASFYSDMWGQILSGKEFHGELNNKKKNGELYWEKTIIAPIISGQKIINFVAVREDITERKKIMAELVEAKIMAEESEKLKTSFLANMSHEIRTPLNSILGFTGILFENTEINEEERKLYTTVIQKSSDSLLQIINDIIDISSLETGQLTIRNSRVDLNELLELLYQEYLRKMDFFPNKKITLKKLSHPESLSLVTDPNRLNQVFINLISNAIKFTEKGLISFGIEHIDDEFIHFIVEDTGIGIPSTMHETIFERFRQAEGNDTRQYGGNGLG